MATSDTKLTGLGKFVIFLFIAACLAGAYYMFMGKSLPKLGGGGTGGSFLGSTPDAEIGIAYGTEKQRWLEWAVQEFAKTSDGKHIKVNLIPMGSMEGAHAVLAADKRINVWSPASAAYKDIFLQEWQVKDSGNPIAREESLALTPMVFVVWDERYQAFLQKYKTMSFVTVNQALQEKGGWNTIAGKPEWGLFKFGHTNPAQSNSGLMTIVLAAYAYQNKTNNLAMQDVLNVDFQNWLEKLERAANGMSNSTGNMMKEMVLKGPSSYDALFVYESVAIDYLKNAEGRWGQLRIVYPEYNAWNENPYYVLNVPWSTADQQKAANVFLNFLLTEPIQKESLNHGFRPANLNVPIKFPESPFVRYANYGFRVDLQKICEPPKADVVNNLLASWQRSQGTR
ncbi:MAG TPA: substrate-binding domain-containing protein [Candidatus Solibacter sp.]|jgi:Bacterial extracellular solute-binding protein|nr:substrate-binding domain-containing protein [Candidatus Solibacter sp.]